MPPRDFASVSADDLDATMVSVARYAALAVASDDMKTMLADARLSKLLGDEKSRELSLKCALIMFETKGRPQ